jgi:glycosyltransferase involved in cell wall biosynthesis
MNDIKSRLNKLKCCVIIPTYNNGNTIKEVLKNVLEFTENIIVVNDGSTDNTEDVLKNSKDYEVINHIKNSGKGSALKTAFRRAIEKGFQYAITIDSDGQHKAEEIPLFIDAIDKSPDSFIIGSRNLNQENLPQKSGFANKFSNFWFRFIAGVRLSDTQSGYRLYPLRCISEMKLFSGKYEFELEVLVRAAWKGYKIISVPINAYYPPAGQRVTHFRPFRDFMRISFLNTILFFVAVFYVKPGKLFKK